MNYDYLVVGAGLSGAVIAERLASIGKKVLVIDKRDHIGGNCYDYINLYGIRVSKYGAHLFHTDSEVVWNYVNRFSKWTRWDHRVLSSTEEGLVPIPVNINTVNKLLQVNIRDEEEMKEWLEKTQVKFDLITNSEEMALSRVGEELYNKLFKEYTVKQWDKEPSDLDPSVLSRIPIRYNFDDRYFTDKYQALPVYGYTHFISNILNHQNIDVRLNTSFESLEETYENVIYTGPIDQYFQGEEKLEYRSLQFEEETYLTPGYYQEASVINYPSKDIPYTRIIEYKHFLHQKSEYTTIVKEYPSEKGEPYYPVPTERNMELYRKYQRMAEKIPNVHFIGRLATYKYYNMDQCILASLVYFDLHLRN